MRFVYHIAATVFIMSLAACTTRTGDLNLIATKNISSLKNA